MRKDEAWLEEAIVQYCLRIADGVRDKELETEIFSALYGARLGNPICDSYADALHEFIVHLIDRSPPRICSWSSEGAPLRSYLRRAFRNFRIDVCMKRQERKYHRELGDVEFQNLPDKKVDFEHKLDEELCRKAWVKSISYFRRQHPSDWEVVRQFYFEQKSYQQIAQEMKVPEVALRKRSERGKQKLSVLLKQVLRKEFNVDLDDLGPDQYDLTLDPGLIRDL